MKKPPKRFVAKIILSTYCNIAISGKPLPKETPHTPYAQIAHLSQYYNKWEHAHICLQIQTLIPTHYLSYYYDKWWSCFLCP